MVLGCNPKGSDAKQLKPIPTDSLNRQIQIDQPNHKEVGLACQLVFLMHIDQPIQQHTSHVLTEIWLDREVIAHSEPVGVGQHESFYLRAVELLLRNGLKGGLRSIGDWQIGWMVFIVDVGLFLRLDMACLTKFHSKQQRMNNEIVYTHLQDLQSSIKKTQEMGRKGWGKSKARMKDGFYPFLGCRQDDDGKDENHLPRSILMISLWQLCRPLFSLISKLMSSSVCLDKNSPLISGPH